MAASTTLVRGSHRSISAHYWVTALLVIALVPLLRAVGLPLKFSWAAYFISYWVALPAQSIFAVSILYVVGFPLSETIEPIVRRLHKQKQRVPFLILLAGFLVWLNGPAFGFVLFVDAIAILEFIDRTSQVRGLAAKMCLDVLVPAAYLFVTFVIVFGYNDIIALRRYTGSWEYTLNRADAFIMGGHTVSPWAHSVVLRWPHLISALQVIYFGMFTQVAATIVILAWKQGRLRALSFVGSAVTAYYIALVIFYWIPATGPYALFCEKVTVPTAGVAVYEIQGALIEVLNQLRGSHSKSFIGMDYFVALPSMHIVLPLIVLWYLRKWRRVAAALIAYDFLMVPAILILEWHYVVDLLAAIPVAALAIAINWRDHPPAQVQIG